LDCGRPVEHHRFLGTTASDSQQLWIALGTTILLTASVISVPLVLVLVLVLVHACMARLLPTRIALVLPPPPAPARPTDGLR